MGQDSEPADEPMDEAGDGAEGPWCVCDPEAPPTCASATAVQRCADDCSEFVEVACDTGDACSGGACGPASCDPSSSICDGDGAVRPCLPDGSGYADPIPCGDEETCDAGVCATACEIAASAGSSSGCSFFALKLDNFFPDVSDSVVVTNPASSGSAVVRLFRGEFGGEVQIGPLLEVAAGGVAFLELESAEMDSGSELRTTGAFRIESSAPVFAHQHSPLTNNASNDASALLPEHAFGTEYVVASYPGSGPFPDQLSYLDVIAAHDDTIVTIVPAVPTLAGPGVDAASPGTPLEVQLDRMQTLQVAAGSSVDISGSVVESDKPVWVVGAAACPTVPVEMGSCDHIQEQMLPVNAWGNEYVAAHAPARGDEPFYWRIYGGIDEVTVTTTPDQLGGPRQLQLGEFVEFATREDFVVSGDGPFLPVQYLESRMTPSHTGVGDPSMVQAVPTGQYLSRYTFATGSEYGEHFVQLVRRVGGPDVFCDGVAVEGWMTLGAFEIADHPVADGVHLAQSSNPFGATLVGYGSFASYASPAGLRL